MKITLSNVLIGKVETQRDRTLKVAVYTNELPSSEKAKLMDASFGEQIVSLELEDTGSSMSNGSPSKRLRSVLYKLWEGTNQSVAFDTYYAQKMEMLIEKIKEQL